MKKITLILAALFCLSGLSFAENIKVKIKGPEGSYNELKLINKTKISSFDSTVYLLKQSKGKVSIKDTLGSFKLKFRGDVDTQKMDLKNGNLIGIQLPEEMTNVAYSITYLDLPFYDIVEITLFQDVDEFVSDPESTEI